MSWAQRAVEKANKLIAQEPELLKKSYSPDFADYCKRAGLFFSFGDISWLIRTSMRYNILSRYHGSTAGIACFETLIDRFRLYLIQELKSVLANERPYKKETVEFDYNLVTDFLDLFKELDELEAWLKEIRQKEGGMYG